MEKKISKEYAGGVCNKFISQDITSVDIFITCCDDTWHDHKISGNKLE